MGTKYQVDTNGDLVLIKGVPYVWPSAQGGANEVITNDGLGNLTWAPGSGGGGATFERSDTIAVLGQTQYATPGAVPYVMGDKSILVFEGGILLTVGADYFEDVSGTFITFYTAPKAGVLLTFMQLTATGGSSPASIVAGTVGALQYNNGLGAFGASSSALFWDSSSSALAIGHASPTCTLDVVGRTKSTVFSEGVAGPTTVTTAATINWSTAAVHKYVLTTGAVCAISFATTPPAGQTIRIFLKQPASGATTTVTWPTIKWSGGVPPTLTPTNSKTTIISVFYDGVDYYGFVNGYDY